MAGVRATAAFDSVAPAALGKYAPVARLGTGGMADVFLALALGPQGVNKLAVVKRLRDSENPALVQMFLDEARIAARLNHPNIVHTYEAGEARGEYFIAMEYLDGQPLSEVTKALAARSSWLSEPLIAALGVQALKGLHYAHEFCDFDGTPLNVVHRDVSPHNLFVTYSGEVKLLDFGIAKVHGNETRTESGVLKGKVRYMAPEQIAGSRVDRRADLWAFGVLFWEMLARRPLFSGAPLNILTRILNEEVPAVRDVRPDVSPHLEAIALRAVRKDLGTRYATADEMRDDLERYLRTCDAPHSDSDLARVMNQLFAATRDDVRARVRTYVANMPVRTEPPSTPGLTGVGITGMRELPALHDISGEILNPSLAPGVTSRFPTAAPAPTSPRWLFAVSITAFGVAAAAAGVLAARSRMLDTPAPVQATEAARAMPAHVHVDSVPPGALVECNGSLCGRTPTELTLMPGPQTLAFSHDGFDPASITMDLKSGDDVTRTIALHAKPASPPQPAQAAPSSPATRTVPVAPKWRRSPAPAAAPQPAPAPSPTEPPPPRRPKIQMLDDDTP